MTRTWRTRTQGQRRSRPRGSLPQRSQKQRQKVRQKGGQKARPHPCRHPHPNRTPQRRTPSRRNHAAYQPPTPRGPRRQPSPARRPAHLERGRRGNDSQSPAKNVPLDHLLQDGHQAGHRDRGQAAHLWLDQGAGWKPVRAVALKGKARGRGVLRAEVVDLCA